MTVHNLFGQSKWIEKRQDQIFAGLLTACLIVLSATVFFASWARLLETVCGFGQSVLYYVRELFGLSHNAPSDPVPPIISDVGTSFPPTASAFGDKMVLYFKTFFRIENLTAFIAALIDRTIIPAQTILFCVPLVVLIGAIVVLNGKRCNQNHGKESKSLTFVKRFTAATCVPVVEWLRKRIVYLRGCRILLFYWRFLILGSLNVLSLCVSLAGFAVYFSSSLAFGELYPQLVRTVGDLVMTWNALPSWLWSLIALYVAKRICERIAYAQLNHFERKNRGFINERPVCMMFVGTMGKSKTTSSTDVALSQSVMFRDVALEKMLAYQMRFPNFPWIVFESALKRVMHAHIVFNLFSARAWVADECNLFCDAPDRSNLYGYDFERYGMTYCDDLIELDIWEALETYAQLYLVYVVESSLILGNLSIREDAVQIDCGNFPLWNSDFFHRSARTRDNYSRYAHVLDFDMLRLGRKMIDHNAKANAFEFGVLVVTEIGKERGNAIELKGIKRDAAECNQLNDRFNEWLKLCRHSATVDNFPFVKVIMDDQREMSLGADARELAEIVEIVNKSERRSVVPFFFVLDLIHDWIYPHFERAYIDYRYRRGDRSLPTHVLINLFAKFHAWIERQHNRFDVIRLDVDVQDGKQVRASKSQRYYLSTKKIYSDRFATDCYSEFFAEKLSKATVGLTDLQCYLTTRPSFEEFGAQNSHFLGNLMQWLLDEKQN